MHGIQFCVRGRVHLYSSLVSRHRFVPSTTSCHDIFISKNIHFPPCSATFHYHRFIENCFHGSYRKYSPELIDVLQYSTKIEVKNTNSSDYYETYNREWISGDEMAKDTLFWCIGTIVLFIGLSFLAVPLYRIFCEATSFGGIAQTAKNFEKISKMEAVKDRVVKVKFGSDTSSSMEWNFKPMQQEIYVYPGETALAFYTAKNPTDKPIIGISSYSIEPFQSAYYFNKIQCFCFEDQLLNPNEEVDLPVFFYLDPDFADDPLLKDMDEIRLNYIFYESLSGLKLLSPFEQNLNNKLA